MAKRRRRTTAKQRVASKRNLVKARRAKPRGRYSSNKKTNRRWHQASLAIAGIGLVSAAGITAYSVYNRRTLSKAKAVTTGSKIGPAPHKVTQYTPPKAKPSNAIIGDDWQRLKPGDVVEVSMPRPRPLGGGVHRFYGVFTGPKRPTRHSSIYRMTLKGENGGMLRGEWIPEHQITGVKVKGAKNFNSSIAALKKERRG